MTLNWQPVVRLGANYSSDVGFQLKMIFYGQMLPHHSYQEPRNLNLSKTADSKISKYSVVLTKCFLSRCFVS